jgi:hypothetical protein
VIVFVGRLKDVIVVVAGKSRDRFLKDKGERIKDESEKP